MNPARICTFALFAAMLAACAPTQPRTSSGSAQGPQAATSAPGAPASPAAQPPAAGASATAVPIAAPTPEPTATPTPVTLDANAPPQILSYSLSASVVHVGETVSGVVITSSNVASVEASVASYVMALTKTSVGHFELSYVVPNIPKPFRGTYALHIVAHNAAGVSTSKSTSLTIR